MLTRCGGSSLIEVLVALILVTAGGMSLAMLQHEAGFMQQQLLWRWQAQQWLAAFVSTDLQPSSLPYLCNNTPPELDCYRHQCTSSDAQLWQHQRLCYAMHQALPHTVVLLKPCAQGTCLSMAATAELAQRCETGLDYCVVQAVVEG